jgi:hypothetical protein
MENEEEDMNEIADTDALVEQFKQRRKTSFPPNNQ